MSGAIKQMPTWLDGLTHKDWLFDGRQIRGEVMRARFANLDWSKAHIDMGPSVAGNLGPYWHVPLKKTIIKGEVYDLGDTVHRLYPKLLQTKWLLIVRQAIQECDCGSDGYAGQLKKRLAEIEAKSSRDRKKKRYYT